jgi:nitroreductase
VSVQKQIHAHRSIRKYKPDSIPEEALTRILQAALRASSSGNMQAYSIIVTTDPAIRRELLPAHFHQEMVVEAPALLTFCADFHRMRRWLALRDAPENFDNLMSFMIGAIDAVLAAQNAALAAEAEGLGICFLGTTLASCDQIARILECPQHVVPVVGFTLGHPDEAPPLRDRLPLEGLVHRERFRRETDEEILETYFARNRRLAQVHAVARAPEAYRGVRSPESGPSVHSAEVHPRKPSRIFSNS